MMSSYVLFYFSLFVRSSCPIVFSRYNPGLRSIYHKRSFEINNFLDDYKEIGETKFPLAICPTEEHRVRFSTTAGDFTIALDKALSPSGVTRFLSLIDDRFFDDMLLYRVAEDFLIQFGVASTPELQARWDPNYGATGTPLSIPDEPNRQEFGKGSVSFAGNGVNTRSCHVFISLVGGFGDAPHETVIGNVEELDGGFLVLDNIVKNRMMAGYGELLDAQNALLSYGNTALQDYPFIDRIISCGRL